VRNRIVLIFVVVFVLVFTSFSNSPALANTNPFPLSLSNVLIIKGSGQVNEVFNGSNITTNKPELDLKFNQSIDPETATSATITLTDSSSNLISNIGVFVEDDIRATIRLRLPQLGPGKYYLKISGVKNYSHTSILTGYTLAFNAIIPKPQQKQFSAGGFHTLWIDPYDGVKAAGNNNFGQLGDNTTVSHFLPIKIPNLSYSVLDVSAGGTHSLALTDSQTVMAWGDNRKGQLGIDSNTNSLVPMEVPGLNGIVAISAGYDFSLALKDDGTVYSFGSNQFSQLGDNVLESRNTPTKIPGLNGIIAIAAGGTHALALRFDGSVFSWGSNSRGELGDSESTSSYSPRMITALNNVTAIAAGLMHSLALTAEQKVYAWGDDSFGQLGDKKTTGYSNVPIKVEGIENGFRIAAGYNSSFVISNQNLTYGFGDNSMNQINNTSVQKLSSPMLLNFRASSISSGWGHTVSDGYNGSNIVQDIWSWGYNQFGQTGNGLTNHSFTPVKPYFSRKPAFFRLYGADRLKTAVAVSSEGWAYGSRTVVLARKDNFPDALAGTPLAYGLSAPILLTDSEELSSDAKNEIHRLAPQAIIILGKEGAISRSIEESLQKDYNVTRIGGQDRYETAAAIAEYMIEYKLISGNTAVIAYGENYPDALAVSSLAAYANMPILLTDKDVLPSSTSQALNLIGATQTIIVGGTGVVGTTVERNLPTPTRYAGNDRYGTAIEIAKGMGVNPNLVYLATGNNFPDALAGSVLAARTNSPIILVDTSLGADAEFWLWNHSRHVKEFYVLGGEGVVSDSILQSAYETVYN
jgi:alpha-tubulin suppressor-like RCC1 family protein/putative cell wall-binding protein